MAFSMVTGQARVLQLGLLGSRLGAGKGEDERARTREDVHQSVVGYSMKRLLGERQRGYLGMS